jgi:hypothetical protein
MKKSLENFSEQLKKDEQVFLNYLKSRFPVFHNSNFFFRDFHYGVRSYFEKKGIKLSYTDAEQVAEEFAFYLEEKKIFAKIAEKTWRVDFPEFVTATPGDPF